MPHEPTDDRLGRIANIAGRYGLLLLLVGLLVFFSVFQTSSFFTVNNYRSILDNQTVVVLLAFAAMFPLLVGQFDLSIAAVLSLTNVFVIGFQSKQGMPVWVAIALTFAIMMTVGLINGLIVVHLKVNAFVATLATGGVLGGVGQWYTGGQTLFDPIPTSFTDLARSRVFGFPLTAIYVIVVTAGLTYLLSYTPMGRRTYATGGNQRAAHLSGIRTRRFLIGSFVMSASLACLAGLVLGARLGTASPNTGSSLLLPAFAGAFLGATTVQPGRFNVVGTVIAVYSLSIAVSGFTQMGAPFWFEAVFNGTALIVAVALSSWLITVQSSRARARELKLLEAERAGIRAAAAAITESASTEPSHQTLQDEFKEPI